MKTLVAGFGNLFLGDDGFGVEVVKRLIARGVPQHVDVVDVGIGGLELVLKLMDGYERVVVVDAVSRGGAPGTITIFEPEAEETTLRAGERIDPHLAEPSRAIKLARHLQVLPASVTIVGCEPDRCEMGIGLSPAVAAGVERALDAIESIVACATAEARPA